MKLTERQIGYGNAIIDIICQYGGINTDIIRVCKEAGVTAEEVEAWVEQNMCPENIKDAIYCLQFNLERK